MENGVVEVDDVLIGDWFGGSVVGGRWGGVGFEEVFEGGDERGVGSGEVEVGGGRGGSAERRERGEEDEERETEEREG